MGLSRRSIPLLLVIAAACDTLAARSVTPSDDAPTPVPILPTPFTLVFASPFRGVVTLMPWDSVVTNVVVITERGDRLPPGVRVTYLSRRPEIATVDSAGTIVARAMGTTWIIASAETIASSDSIQLTVRCTMELGVDLHPSELTIRVGESFVPTVLLWTCGRRVTLEDSFTWRTHNPQIVEVDSTTGRTTGRAPGIASVFPVGRVYRSLSTVRVTVLPAQ